MKKQKKNLNGAVPPAKLPAHSTAMTLEEIARHIAVLVVRQHRKLTVRGGKKEG